MTPATQREVLLTELVLPQDPVASPERVTWTATDRNWARSGWPGTETLLSDFIDLQRAQPDEMAAFIKSYGAPEIPGGFADTDGRGQLDVELLRQYARGIAAARRVGAALVSRRAGALDDWLEMERVSLIHWPDKDDFDDPMLGRERFAQWMSVMFAGTKVTAQADWVGIRGLAIQPTAGSLLGLVAILLAREVGAEGEYECDACGARVFRSRPPRQGESVYCDRPECKREQQRRNQARWRAKKAQEAGE